MAERLSREAVKIVNSAIGKKPIGRNVSNRAVIAKGIVKAIHGGGTSFSWQIREDPTRPKIAQENYQLDITPMYNKGGDLVRYKLFTDVEITRIPRPIKSKIIAGLDKTKNSCSVGFLSSDDMSVNCSYMEHVQYGRFEDWIEDKDDLIKGINRVVSLARNRIYSNFS